LEIYRWARLDMCHVKTHNKILMEETPVWRRKTMGGRWEADGEFWFGNQGSAGCAAESKHIILVERDLLLTSAWEKPYRANW